MLYSCAHMTAVGVKGLMSNSVISVALEWPFRLFWMFLNPIPWKVQRGYYCYRDMGDTTEASRGPPHRDIHCIQHVTALSLSEAWNSLLFGLSGGRGLCICSVCRTTEFGIYPADITHRRIHMIQTEWSIMFQTGREQKAGLQIAVGYQYKKSSATKYPHNDCVEKVVLLPIQTSVTDIKCMVVQRNHTWRSTTTL